MSLFDNILAALDHGWKVYTGSVEPRVYERLECKASKKARWLSRNEAMLCLGCGHKCMTHQDGFARCLPGMDGVAKRILYTDRIHRLTITEYLSLGRPLRVDEAAWILNISERHVRDLVDEGVLQRMEDRPLRITASSLKQELEKR